MLEKNNFFTGKTVVVEIVHRLIQGLSHILGLGSSVLRTQLAEESVVVVVGGSTDEFFLAQTGSQTFFSRVDLNRFLHKSFQGCSPDSLQWIRTEGTSLVGRNSWNIIFQWFTELCYVTVSAKNVQQLVPRLDFADTSLRAKEQPERNGMQSRHWRNNWSWYNAKVTPCLDLWFSFFFLPRIQPKLARWE